jgi:hypothetical protein
MPRRDRDDDDRDDDFDDRPRPDRGGNPVMIVLVVAGGLLFLIVLACAGLWFVGSRAANQAVERAEAEAAKEAAMVMTREQWEKAVMGKTPDELIASVGRPNRTIDNPDKTLWRWSYFDRVTNPVTGQADSVTLEFEDGMVVRILW